jgi:uncharacterized protein YcbK (DUF882 family)
LLKPAFRSNIQTVGGASQSKHILGQAIDFCAEKLPPSKVQTLLKNHSGGLGAYKNFTHMDVAEKRRWTGGRFGYHSQ